LLNHQNEKKNSFAFPFHIQQTILGERRKKKRKNEKIIKMTTNNLMMLRRGGKSVTKTVMAKGNKFVQ
jgi:hypothetical protein